MPKIPEKQEYMFPLGIAYVSSSLKKSGYNVFTLNLNFYEDWRKELESVLYKNNIDVVGTGGLTADYKQISEIISFVKSVRPSVIFVLGGGIVTASTKIIFDLFPELDIAMQREGEHAWIELMKTITEGKELDEVPNIIFKKNGELVINHLANDIENIDSLPYPDYDGFGYKEAMKSIEESGYWIGNRPAFILSSRSCPYKCTFCFHTAGTKYRRASLKRIFEEIDYMIAKYDCKDFNFSDELFGLEEEYVLEFCKLIKERKVTWSVSMRVDCITEQMAREMSLSGCKWILYGIESADDRILKSMKKNITVSQIDYALSISRKYNLGVIGYLIFGDPEETQESVNKSLEWWINNLDMGIGLNMIKAFPGSKNYELCVSNGTIQSEVEFIKNGCPIINTTRLSDEEYYLIYAKVESHKMYYLHMPRVINIIGKNSKDKTITFKYVCTHCGSEHMCTAGYREKKRLICDNCNQIMDISLVRYFDEIIKKAFSKIANTKQEILISSDKEADYELAFALQKCGYSVYMRSSGKNLYEHRDLWGISTIYDYEADEMVKKENVLSISNDKISDGDLYNAFIQELETLHKTTYTEIEGGNSEIYDKRRFGISGQAL